jgi:hypothetical protein
VGEVSARPKTLAKAIAPNEANDREKFYAMYSRILTSVAAAGADAGQEGEAVAGSTGGGQAVEGGVGAPPAAKP